MNTTEPTIEISRGNGVLQVKAIIPTWTKEMEDGTIKILLPHLGGAVAFVETAREVEKTINEMFEAFCIMVEKHGQGLEHELELIGWKQLRKHKVNHSLLNMQPKPGVYDFMLTTGDSRLLQVDIC